MRGDTGVVLAAGGSGRRFGAKKQLMSLRGKPLLHYSLDTLAGLEAVSRLVIVMPREDLDTGRCLLEEWLSGRRAEPSRDNEPRFDMIEGGPRRQDSVVNGLRLLRASVRCVLVHDAARPLLRADEARRVLDAVRAHGAAVIGTPVTDSVKRVEEGRIVESLPRQQVWTVQTPQGAILETLLEAYEARESEEFTDEASALGAAGVPVFVVEGSPENIKITRPRDVVLAEKILQTRSTGEEMT